MQNRPDINLQPYLSIITPNRPCTSGGVHIKLIVYNELVANAVVLQTGVDQTQALHALSAAGYTIRPADVAHLSPYGTSTVKRFGDFPTELTPESLMPAARVAQRRGFSPRSWGT